MATENDRGGGKKKNGGKFFDSKMIKRNKMDLDRDVR